MARTVDRLNARLVAAKSAPGLYSDGNGLYLQVTKHGVKSWLFRYMRSGKSRGMGLGPIHTVSLKEAREAALAARKQLQAGIDPLDVKASDARMGKVTAAKRLTFAEAAATYIDAHKAGWKNDKHITQWTNTLVTYAYPVFGKLSIADVDTALVVKALAPIWNTKNETASRVRGRIESILGWATVSGHRQGDNPARWRDHLDKLLPKPSSVQKPEHHAALPHAEIGEFFAVLESRPGPAARALALLILTAARTGEVIGAQWSEFDLVAKVWTVPANRMKAKKEHRVPLSAPALDILAKIKSDSTTELLFPGRRDGESMSNMAMLELLKRMERRDLTAHGFRSTFRDWAGETTTYPREVCEAALAHGIADKAEAAYARGDLFTKRAQLMTDWGAFCKTTKLKS